MKALKVIGIALLAIVVIVAILAFTLPTEFGVERSTTIKAPKALVKDQIVYFENMNNWSPWSKLDPDMEQRVEGEDGTVGAKMFWDGNEKAGKGVQEIKKIEENRIETHIKFIKPFESEATSYHILNKQDTGVQVTWGFKSEMPRPFNVLSLFMDMEKNIAKDYDKGLESLKKISESKAEESAQSKYEVEEIDYPAQKFLTYREEVPFDGMQAFYTKHLGAIYQFIGKSQEMQSAGQPCGIYYTWNESEQIADMAGAVPFKADGKVTNTGDYTVEEFSGKAYKIAYRGSYDNLGEAHIAMEDYLRNNNISMNNVAMEQYQTDPSTQPDTAKWLTNIYYFPQD
jgi:effector-binding domain-containing protein